MTHFEKMNFDIPKIEDKVEISPKSEFKIFCCFVYDEQNISVALKDNFTDSEFRDNYIDKDKSIILQFQSEKEAKQFFGAITIQQDTLFAHNFYPFYSKKLAI